MLQLNWSALTSEEIGIVLQSADPSRISLLDTDYLLEYAAEDTDLTWMFYTHILKPVLDKFVAYAEYHKDYFIPLVTHHVIQQLGGIWIDTEHMANVKEDLLAQQYTAHQNILEHVTIRAGIDAFNQAVLDAVKVDKPKQTHKKIPDRKPEPKKFTKEGHVSRNWKAWYALEEEIQRMEENPTVIPRYQKYLDKVAELEVAIMNYDELSDDDLKKYQLFNPKSATDKRWLLYEALRFPVKVFVWNKNNPDKRDTPAVDESALRGMGEVGELFNAWQAITKELSFVESLMSRLYGDIFHPQFKVPGTYTGRLSGAGGFSVQILPKSTAFLEAFRPRPGHKLVDIDVSALEPVVLTELSRDRGLLSVYGPTASPYSDIYLTVGSRLGTMGQPFRDCGYDYLNPTKEATAKCKKEHKNLRNIVKKLHLSCSYGAGAGKVCSSLQLDGVSITYDEVKTLHAEYWNIFGDVREYERKLIAQAEKNGGWFLGGMGFPICVCSDKMKDILNRQVQSTGHVVLTFLQKQIADDLVKARIPYRPYIWDLHDEIIIEVPDAYADVAFKIMNDAFAKVNSTLQNGDTMVKFKGSGDIMYSLAEAKVEDYQSKWRDDK